MTMGLRINVLGPFEVKNDRGELRVGPKKAKALLTYLAVHGEQAISRERLSDLLWPLEAPEQSRHSLRNCLMEIRKALGEAAAVHFCVDQVTCRLRDVEVDLAACYAAARSGDRSAMLAASELYRGELLADFFLRSESFEEWLTGARERALNLACEILERVSEQQYASGDYLGAIGSARRLVTLDRLSEAGHRALMRAYARAGRRAEALRHYRRCGEILKRELGVTPDTETDALARRIAGSGSSPSGAPVQRSYAMPEGRALMLSDRSDRYAAEEVRWVPPWEANR
jgi:DNA-binding SARP family transcriptional activator